VLVLIYQHGVAVTTPSLAYGFQDLSNPNALFCICVALEASQKPCHLKTTICDAVVCKSLGATHASCTYLHLKPILPRQDIHTFAVCQGAVLTRRSFATTLDLMGTALDIAETLLVTEYRRREGGGANDTRALIVADKRQSGCSLASIYDSCVGSRQDALLALVSQSKNLLQYMREKLAACLL
jgi:hypothetical protein